jgi:hypothetical protein
MTPAKSGLFHAPIALMSALIRQSPPLRFLPGFSALLDQQLLQVRQRL